MTEIKTMGMRSRRKGRKWEQDVAAVLREIYPLAEIYRGHQHLRGGAGGGEGCDVEGTPWWVECKHQQQTNPRAALRQAVDARAAKRDQRPVVVVCKDDRPPPGWRVGLPKSPPTVTMLLEEWVALVAELRELREETERKKEKQRNARPTRRLRRTRQNDDGSVGADDPVPRLQQPR